MQYIKKVEKPHLLETSQKLWQEININIIRLLSRLNDKNMKVVIVD